MSLWRHGVKLKRHIYRKSIQIRHLQVAISQSHPDSIDYYLQSCLGKLILGSIMQVFFGIYSESSWMWCQNGDMDFEYRKGCKHYAHSPLLIFGNLKFYALRLRNSNPPKPSSKSVVGRILRQFSHLVSELGDLFGQFRILLDKRFIDFNKFSNLFFKFRDAANIELFCFSSQVLSSSLPTRLLSDKFRAFA